MIVAGFGFRGEAGTDSLREAYASACDGLRADALATAADKAEAAPMTALAQKLGLPLHAVADDALRAQTTLTQSPAALAARGTGSMAEAAALAAAGPGAQLLGPRVISRDRMASCALARADSARYVPPQGETP